MLEPDLTFYFSSSKKYDIVTQKIVDTTIYQTRSGPIFSDENLLQQIGKFASSTVIYDINNLDNISKNEYTRTGEFTYFLPQGQITIPLNDIVYKTVEGTYSALIGRGENIYKIINGSKNFLFVTGIVVGMDNSDLSRKALVYFNKQNNIKLI